MRTIKCFSSSNYYYMRHNFYDKTVESGCSDNDNYTDAATGPKVDLLLPLPPWCTSLDQSLDHSIQDVWGWQLWQPLEALLWPEIIFRVMCLWRNSQKFNIKQRFLGQEFRVYLYQKWQQPSLLSVPPLQYLCRSLSLTRAPVTQKQNDLKYHLHLQNIVPFFLELMKKYNTRSKYLTFIGTKWHPLTVVPMDGSVFHWYDSPPPFFAIAFAFVFALGFIVVF